MPREEIAVLCRKLQASGRKIGFTSGVFDLLHPGHVDYLEKSRSLCDALVVGVNSDASVKRYKDELRPICQQQYRAQVVAGLAAVDYVFVFDESNNQRNVELLKPDIYFKAADYSKAKLTSAPLVESWGGRVEIVPRFGDYSSSAVIDRVLNTFLHSKAGSIVRPPLEMRPAVFLDRDGTLNEHIEYLHEPEKFRLLPGTLEALKKLSVAGFRLVVVTNQPGIGLGYYKKEDFFAVNKELLRACGKAGVLIDKIYFCPHSQSENCECRKPKTALLERAAKELNVDLKRSFVIGDMSSDVMLGKNAGCKSVWVRPPGVQADKLFDVTADFNAENLEQAAEWIIKAAKEESKEENG